MNLTILGIVLLVLGVGIFILTVCRGDGSDIVAGGGAGITAVLLMAALILLILPKKGCKENYTNIFNTYEELSTKTDDFNFVSVEQYKAYKDEIEEYNNKVTAIKDNIDSRWRWYYKVVDKDNNGNYIFPPIVDLDKIERETYEKEFSK